MGVAEYEACELLSIGVDPLCPEKQVRIGQRMDSDTRIAVERVLKANKHMFAWQPEDMVGIDQRVVVHKLNVQPIAKSIKQKRRHFAAQQDEIIRKEVDGLLAIGHIREIQFPHWLANVVLVLKDNGKWRMCVDFRQLNKAYPRDHYPLPRIDQLVDSTAGCALLSMMDAFQGYHPIQLHHADQPNVAFIRSTGTYYYTVMPFGLKNPGATYQKMMDQMFRSQLVRNMEVYVDDMLVKSKIARTHADDLQETMTTMRRYGMRLNPTKCAFGVQADKFLDTWSRKKG